MSPPHPGPQECCRGTRDKIIPCDSGRERLAWLPPTAPSLPGGKTKNQTVVVGIALHGPPRDISNFGQPSRAHWPLLCPLTYSTLCPGSRTDLLTPGPPFLPFSGSCPRSCPALHTDSSRNPLTDSRLQTSPLWPQHTSLTFLVATPHPPLASPSLEVWQVIGEGRGLRAS